MRNQLNTRTSIIPEVVYAANGRLDGHDAELHAWSQGRLTLDFGPACIALSPAAAAELVAHLQAALAAQGKEVLQCA